MTVPATLIESNPLSTALFPQTWDGSADLACNSRSFGSSGVIYGRQTANVAMIGTNTLNAAIVFKLQGAVTGGAFEDIASKTITSGIGDDDKTYVINLFDHELQELGYDKYKAVLSTTSGSGSAVVTMAVFTGALRYGLSGTNAEIASAMPSSLDITLLNSAVS